jgi:hypothetical protein
VLPLSAVARHFVWRPVDTNELGKPVRSADSAKRKWEVSAIPNPVPVEHGPREDLIPMECRTAGLNLTKKESDEYFPGEFYRKTRPKFPPGEGVQLKAELFPKQSAKKAGN